MARHHIKVVSYYIFHDSQEWSTDQEVSSIQLGIESGKKYSSVICRFIPEDKPMPKNRQMSTSWFCYFRLARFSHIIDTLRNEKPIYIQINDVTGATTIKTNREPVGEAESRYG